MNNALSETQEIHRAATAIPDDSYPLPLERFYHFEKNHSQKPFLIQPRKGEVQTWTWHEVGQEVRRFAAYLKSLDLPVGSHIALLSTNCAHWIMSDLAIWMAGHVTVPLCPTLTEHSVNQILVHSDAALLMVGKLDDWPTMKAGVLKGMPRVALPGGPVSQGYTQWADLLRCNEPLQGKPARMPEEVATIMYTPRSTGVPKGVMLSFFAMAAAAIEGGKGDSVGMGDRVLSYLPLSRVDERLLVEIPALYFGLEVYFSEGPECQPGDKHS